MRNYLFCSFLLFCLCCSTNVWTQSSFGIKLGMGLSTPSITVMPDTYDSWLPESRFGAVFGVFAQVPLRGEWVFLPAVQFSSKGFKERHASTTSNYNFTLANPYFYLDIPLNFVHTSSAKGNGFQLGGGPVLSYLLNNRYRSHAAKSVDFGVNGLLGYQTPIGFSVQMNYTFGFANAGDKAYHVTNLKNRFAALTIGYLF